MEKIEFPKLWVFSNELRHAVRTRDEAVLDQNRLTVEQEKRSLLHILRETFADHNKSSLILQNYGEQSYQQSGFVALRLLAKGFCLKSWSECLYSWTAYQPDSEGS